MDKEDDISNKSNYIFIDSDNEYEDFVGTAGTSMKITEITSEYNSDEDSETASKEILLDMVDNVVRTSETRQQSDASLTSSRAIVVKYKSSPDQNREVTATSPEDSQLVVYRRSTLQESPSTYSEYFQIGSNRRNLRFFVGREFRVHPSPAFMTPLTSRDYTRPRRILPLDLSSVEATSAQHQFQINHHRDFVFGVNPMSLICPSCNNFVITSIHTRTSKRAHFAAAVLCLCCCLPCCLLPYWLKPFQVTYHDCPLCYELIGIHDPSNV